MLNTMIRDLMTEAICTGYSGEHSTLPILFKKIT